MSYIVPLTTFLAAILGAAIPGVLAYMLEKRKIRDQSLHIFKETRYKAIIILMYGLFNFDKYGNTLQKNNSNISDKEKLKDELLIELANMTLFAKDEVIFSVKKFINEPSEDHYYNATLEMRRDLYKAKTELTVNSLKMNS